MIITVDYDELAAGPVLVGASYVFIDVTGQHGPNRLLVERSGNFFATHEVLAAINKDRVEARPDVVRAQP